MFVGGWIFSYVILIAFIRAGVFEIQGSDIIIPLTVLAVIGTIVESLPFKDIDNLTIPAATMIAGYLLFQVM
jgi:phytol kinase